MAVPLTTLVVSLAAAEPLAASVAAGSVPTVGIAGSVFAVLLVGILGITDLLDGGDDDDDDGGDDDIFDDGGGDDLGDLGDLDDGDGGLGDLDDDGLGGGGGDGNVSELENRIEELEDEVASVSSSLNTVQNENEAVSETVTEIEDNVRDLLEIYEMVTRGVNPFVDEASSPGMGGEAGGNFGLFEDDGQDEAADVDDSIADADAEEFFEDDFEEPDGDALADPDEAVLDADDGDDPHEPADGLLGGDADDESGEDGDDDGKSFEELKEEYESGDPDWDVDDPDGGDGDTEEDPVDDGELGDIEEDSVDDGELGDLEEDPVDDAAIEGLEDDGIGGDGPADGLDVNDEREAGTGDVKPDASDEFVYEAAEDTATSDDADADEEFDFVGDDQQQSASEEADQDERLHLASFPDGYLADLTAIEWLEFLIEVGGPDGARDALGYYVDVGWISPAVEDVLHSFLSGMRVSTDAERPEPGGLGRYDPEDHRRSLAYVARLAGDGDRAAVFDQVGGPTAGVSPEAASVGEPLMTDGAPSQPPGGEDDGV